MKLNFMRHLFVFCLVFLLGVGPKAFAQITASMYGFNTSSGTYTPITSGTPITGISVDDGTSGPIPIGFDFLYCGVVYNQIVVSSNGWLSFNPTASGSNYTNTAANISTIAPALLPLWDDLSGNLGTPSYITEGVAPNRVFTVQFTNWKWNLSSSVTNISYQVKLYENTNIIQYIYKPEASTVNNGSASIAIGDGSTYLSVNSTANTATASSTVFTTSLNTMPATGQVFEFTPPAPCSGAPTAGTLTVSDTLLCPGHPLTLTLPMNVIASGFQYIVQFSANNTTYNTVTTSQANSITINPTATGYYRVIKTCGAFSDTSNVAYVAIQGGLPGGTYTVNNAQPTGATNFNNFTDLAAALNCGILGPIVVNVASGSGPYTERFLLDEIGNASAVNRVTINGNGATLQFTPTSTANMGLVVLNGTKYLTLDNLVIKSNSPTYGHGFIITNGAQYDTIRNCTVDLSAVTTTTSTNSTGLSMTASLTSPTSYGANAKDFYIGNNKFICGSPTSAGGAYYGMSINGTSSSVGGTERVVVENNEISNFYYYGIRAYYGDGLVFKNNNIHKSTKTSITASQYGLYLYYQQNLVVDGNRVHDFGVPTALYSSGILYPIYIYYPSGTVTNPSIIKNNAIYNIGSLGSTNYGLYVYSTSFADVMHNTITYDRAITGTGTMYGMYLGGSGNGNRVINNVVSITKGTTGTKYGAYYSGTAFAGTNIQKNNIYVNSTQTGTQYWGYYSVARATLAAFQAAYPTMEVGSQSVDPEFIDAANGDLTPGNASLLLSGNNVLTSVDRDILGTVRLGTPTVGAFERPITGVNNAGIPSLVTPVNNYCPGVQPVKARVMNFGTNVLDSVQVNWSINGVLQTPVMNYTALGSPLNSTNYITDITLGNHTFVANQTDTIKIWSSLPNGGVDSINYNDTLLVITTPTIYEATTNMTAACAGQPIMASLTPNSVYATGDITWQYSNNNGASWTNFANSDSVNHLFTINTSTIVRAQVQGGAIVCPSTEAPITFSNPQVLAHFDTFNCGPDSMLLRANGSVGTTVRWYADATSATPLHVGDSFMTPFLNATTQYYVSAGAGPVQPGPSSVGSATTTTTGSYSPYYASYSSHKSQYLVKADELAALGFNIGYINAIGFKVMSTTTTTPLENFEVKIKATNASAITTFETGLTTVYSNPSHTITASTQNYLMYQFNTPFYWDGVSNLIIEICFENAAAPSGTTTITYSSPGFSSSVYNYVNAAGNCTNTTGSIYSTTSRPNIQFEMLSTCESPRVATEAKVVEEPTVGLPNDYSVCLAPGETEELTVNTVIPSYHYTWDNNTTTLPREITSTGLYSLRVVDTYGCVAYDTVKVTVLEAPILTLPDEVDLCEGSDVTLDGGASGTYWYWSTGQSTRTITVSQPGEYTLIIGNTNNCERRDTVDVVIVGQMPEVGAIIAHATGGNTFTFSTYNAQNVVGYLWDFGDGTTSTLATPTHTYAAQGTYYVTLNSNSVCGNTLDTAVVNVLTSTGLNNVNDDKYIKAYPNPTTGKITLALSNGIQLNGYVIYNTLGQRVYEMSKIAVQNANEIEVVLPNHLPAGIYQIYMETNQGFMNKSIHLNR